MALLFEYMIRAETHDRVCRIWRQAEGPRATVTADIKSLAISVMRSGGSLVEIVTELVNFDGVNSVEVIDKKTGDGVCVHKDWP